MDKLSKRLKDRMETMQEHEEIPVTVTTDTGRKFPIRLRRSSIPKAARMTGVLRLDYNEEGVS